MFGQNARTWDGRTPEPAVFTNIHQPEWLMIKND